MISPTYAVDLAGACFAQLMSAEATGLDCDTADPRGACGIDIPHAVTDSQRTSRIDGEPLHGAQEDLGVGLGFLDIVGGGLTVNCIIGIERFPQSDQLAIGCRSGEHHHEPTLVDLSQCLSCPGECQHVSREHRDERGALLTGLGAVMTQELGEELFSPHTDESMDGIHGSPLPRLRAAHVTRRPCAGSSCRTVSRRHRRAPRGGGPSSRRWVLGTVRRSSPFAYRQAIAPCMRIGGNRARVFGLLLCSHRLAGRFGSLLPMSTHLDALPSRTRVNRSRREDLATKLEGYSLSTQSGEFASHLTGYTPCRFRRSSVSSSWSSDGIPVGPLGETVIMIVMKGVLSR